MVTMSAILSSRFVSGIQTEVEKVERQLTLFTETLDEWMAAQKSWVYLEPIFRCGWVTRYRPLALAGPFCGASCYASVRDVVRLYVRLKQIT